MSHNIYKTLGALLASIGPLTSHGSSPSLIQGHNKEAICAVLNDEVPDIIIHSINLISTGWDNLVAEINDEWIFRFPREKEFIPALQREQILLKHLQNYVSMPVPYYEHIGLNTAFVGYRKIPGEALSKELYLSLQDTVRQEIAESLALFLSQFHSAVLIEDALKWGYEKHQIKLEWIEYDLLDTLPLDEVRRIIIEALDYAKKNLCKTKNPVLLQNDLHGGNLAFDTKKRQVTGVFDFSDAAIEEHFAEFEKLFSIHQDLAIRTSKAYAKLRDTENRIIPAAAEYILRRATSVLHAKERKDTLREANLAQMLQHFVPIWDSLQKTKPFELP